MELNKIQITSIVSLILILSGIVVVSNISKTYYCQSEDSIKECNRLSLTNRTCYYLKNLTEIADLCTNGVWQSLEKFTKRINPEYKFCDKVGVENIRCCLYDLNIDYPDGVNRCEVI